MKTTSAADLTETQKKYMELCEEHGGVNAAARALGINPSTVSRSAAVAKRKLGLIPAPSKKSLLTGESWLVIPDTQIYPGADMLFMHCIGEYILHKRPHGVIMLGDLADMESLSSYDKGKRSYEGRRYKNDIECVITAQSILWAPVRKYNARVSTRKQYNPRTVFLEGNHEERGRRATDLDPMLYGTIDTLRDLKVREFWQEVHEFLKVVVINGVAFSHYFGTGLMNKPCSTAQIQLRKMHMSCIAGHQQGRQTFTERSADGRLLTSIIAGSSYPYDFSYLGPQGNNHWRGVLMLHNMKDGQFDEVYVPTQYLLSKYGQGKGPMMYAPEDIK